MKNVTFKYNLNKKNHFKYLLKGQFKTISFFLFLFTFCYFAINLEAFLYNFPKNTPVVLITYLIYLVVIFIIMFLMSLIFSLVMTNLYKKNNAYKIYEYKINNRELIEVTDNVKLLLSEVKSMKIKKDCIKLVFLKSKQIVTFEKNNFINDNDFENLKKLLEKID